MGETPTEGSTQPSADLEMAFIREYLNAHPPTRPLTPEEEKRRQRDAMLYAALKMEEIAGRARLMKGLQD
ncbi:MAG: hypothetical protein BWY52_03366 [Chloroflexi bacterium ADurb.Bin325]|nr:MAG: hypothetical protein BWY52_03366 [Chloroflexi bacterium ADurb.Bin325]